MLTTLLESRGRSPRRRAALIGSAFAHTVMLTVLVMSKANGDEATAEEPLPPIVYVPAQPNNPIEPQPQRASSISPSNTIVPQLPTVERLPQFQILPNVGPGLGPISEGRIVFHFDTAVTAARSQSEPFFAHAVDQQVELIPGQQPPRYPLTLERAGIEGDVVAQFVVDTVGRVEPWSVNVLDATHGEFARTVRERIPGLRFLPARARGRVVRQLVEQRFHFEVVRR